MKYFFNNKQELLSFCKLMQLFYDLSEPSEFVDYMFDDKLNYVSKYSMILQYNRSSQWKYFYKIAFCVDSVRINLPEKINSHIKLNSNAKVNQSKFDIWQTFREHIRCIAEQFSLLFMHFYNYVENMQDHELSTHTYEQLQNQIQKLYLSFNKHEYVRNVDVDHFVTFYHELSLNDFHTIHTSFFMDMHVLAQLYKKEEDDMIILYAGHRHCEYLFKLLYTNFGYTPYARIPVQLSKDRQHIRYLDLHQLDYPDLNFNEWLSTKRNKRLASVHQQN